MDNEKRIERLCETLRQLGNGIDSESQRVERVARNELRLFRLLNSLFAILGVAAPTILAYHKDAPGSPWVLVGIILSASTGAWAAVQAINRWGDRYKSSFMASHQLSHLATDAKMLLEDVATGGEHMENYHRLKTGIKDVTERYSQIRKTLVDTQLALVDKSMDEIKKTPNDKSAA